MLGLQIDAYKSGTLKNSSEKIWTERQEFQLSTRISIGPITFITPPEKTSQIDGINCIYQMAVAHYFLTVTLFDAQYTHFYVQGIQPLWVYLKSSAKKLSAATHF